MKKPNWKKLVEFYFNLALATYGWLMLTFYIITMFVSIFKPITLTYVGCFDFVVSVFFIEHSTTYFEELKKRIG